MSEETMLERMIGAMHAAAGEVGTANVEAMAKAALQAIREVDGFDVETSERFAVVIDAILSGKTLAARHKNNWLRRV